MRSRRNLDETMKRELTPSELEQVVSATEQRCRTSYFVTEKLSFTGYRDERKTPGAAWLKFSKTATRPGGATGVGNAPATN